MDIKPRIISRADVKQRISANKPEEFHVAALDGVVLLKIMSGADRDALEAGLFGHKAPTPGGRLNLLNMRARTIAFSWCSDMDGTLMYDPNNPADLDELGALDIAVLQPIFKRVQEINKLSDEDVKTLTKKSQKTADSDSGLLSPLHLDSNLNESAKNGSTVPNLQNG